MTKGSSSAEVAAEIKALLIEKRRKPHDDEEEADADRADAARLDALRRLMGQLVARGELRWHLPGSSHTTTTTNKSAVQAKWQAFLHQSHQQMIVQLCQRIQQGQKTAMRCLWGVVAASPCVSHNQQYQLVSTDLILQWVRAMTPTQRLRHKKSSHHHGSVIMEDPALLQDQGLRHMIQVEFLQPYRDVQYYTMIALTIRAHELYQLHDLHRDPNEEDFGAPSRAKETASSLLTVMTDRLIELLMMIPLPSSQRELEKDGQAYLYPPPPDADPDVEEKDPDDDDDDGDLDNNEEEDEDDYDDEEEEDDEEKDDDDDDENDEGDGNNKITTKSTANTLLTRRFAFQQVRQHRRVWSKAWLAVLRLPLSSTALKKVLQFLPDSVLPCVPNPLRLADFFMGAYNHHQGLVSVLALDGLFLLMTQHGLEYPAFYKQLYRLLHPSVFYVRYRTRFFRLLDKCLSRNEMLPAHVVAAFIKRLQRISMSAPPAGILFALALCSNLLRKHPETTCLIHRDTSKSSGSAELMDGFDANTDDPEQANALQSSLWELHALERHYYPAVVTMAKALGRPEELSTPLHNLEDFLSLTYPALFEQERKRKRKNQGTPLTFVKPTGLFTDQDVFAGMLAIPHRHKKNDSR